MGIPDTLAARLIETIKTEGLTGDFLMLGRQKWGGSRRGASAQLLGEAIRTHLPGLSEADLANPTDDFAETFFWKLGFNTVNSMDFSPYEGASIIQDLSMPVNSAYDNNFDVIYDGGTCEHIFELPTAYRNIDRMLRPGGVLIGHSPCNNWINHSFYQINPEMVYGYWEKARGYQVLHLSLQPLMPAHANAVVMTTNPNETNVRPRLLAKPPQASPLVLNYVVRKPVQPTDANGVYQTDYMAKWSGS